MHFIPFKQYLCICPVSFELAATSITTTTATTATAAAAPPPTTTSSIKIESYTYKPLKHFVQSTSHEHRFCRSLFILASLFEPKHQYAQAFAINSGRDNITMDGLFNENKLDFAGCVSLFWTPRSIFFPIIFIKIFYFSMDDAFGVCACVCMKGRGSGTGYALVILFAINFPSI